MTEDPQAVGDVPVPVYAYALPTLPERFWTARPVHKHIRRAAHARLVSADLVLHATLARISALRSHQLFFDSGRGLSSLNHFVATVGASGTGKSTGSAAAEETLIVPGYLVPPLGDEPPVFADGIPLGSGEGLCELFMGTRKVEIDTAKNGDPIMRSVRCLVRHNAFVTVDEGETFTKVGERKGSTVGATLRSAWSGSAIGQANGRDDTTRIIPARSYSLGMVVGFQPSTALPLLEDTATGMAQRFIWVSAVDPAIPDAPQEWPGRLALAALMENPESGDAVAIPRTGTLAFPEAVIAELRADHLAKARGQIVVPERDSQAPLMRCKLAALLALLAGEHEKVTEDDWELAAILWDTSCAVRDAVSNAAAEEKARQAEILAQARVQLAERQAAAVAAVPAKIDRLAMVLARHVVERGGLLRDAGRKTMAGRDKHLYDQVVERAAELGLLRIADGGALLPPLTDGYTK